MKLLGRSAIVRARRGWLFVAFALWGALGFVPIAFLIPFALAHGHVLLYALLAMLGVGYPAGTIVLGRAWTSRWSERRRDVRVDEHGLWLDGALAWKRSTIRHARVEGEWLHVRGRLREASIALGDEAAASLVAMRLDPERSVARFTMVNGSRVRSFFDAAIVVVGYVIAAVLLMRGLALEGAAVFLAALAHATVNGIRSYTSVEVGADGIRFARRLARKRFVPFGALERVDVVNHDVRIHLRNGEVIVVHRPERKASKLAFVALPEERAALVERVRAQMERHHARGDGGAFARGGRSTAKWLEDLDQVGQPATFRTPEVPRDALWRIVEDATADTTARAGAAYALREALDAPGRDRLRVLADACAAPRLRFALEGIADESTDVQAAFESLAEEALADETFARKRLRKR